jgi:TctA family transporter
VLHGRGHEAAWSSGLGGSLALLLIAPVRQRAVPPTRQVIQPYQRWIVGLIAICALLSVWPRGSDHGDAVWSPLWSGQQSLLAWATTFALSGSLGVLVPYRPLVPLGVSFQSLAPAFVGLLAIPRVLQNLASRTPISTHCARDGSAIQPGMVARGVSPEVGDGPLAAFLSIVNGSIESLVAGHAAAQSDDRALSRPKARAMWSITFLLTPWPRPQHPPCSEPVTWVRRCEGGPQDSTVIR